MAAPRGWMRASASPRRTVSDWARVWALSRAGADACSAGMAGASAAARGAAAVAAGLAGGGATRFSTTPNQTA